MTNVRLEFPGGCTPGLLNFGYALLLGNMVDEALEAMVPTLRVFAMIGPLRAPEKTCATRRKVPSALGVGCF